MTGNAPKPPLRYAFRDNAPDAGREVDVAIKAQV